MTDDEALAMIKKSVDEVSAGASERINMSTHLVDDDILDSLDVMNFMFELEKLHGKSLPGVDEEFSDFRVSKLVEILKK